MKRQIAWRSVNRPIFLLIATCMAVGNGAALAHPTIHEDGASLGFYSKPTFREWVASYSIKNWLSVGVRYFELNHQKNSQMGVATAGVLLWRGNYEDSQSNLWVTGGVGGENSVSSSSVAGFFSPEWDWESRTWMAAAKYELLPGISNAPNNLLRVRAGHAAFQGETEQLNIWLVMQVDYHPIGDINLPVTFHPAQNLVELQWTPVRRLTYKNANLELGASNNGAGHLNFEVHY